MISSENRFTLFRIMLLARACSRRETAPHFSGSCFWLEHDLVGKPLHTFPDHAFYLSMVSSENRFALFRIMLYSITAALRMQTIIAAAGFSVRLRMTCGRSHR